MLLVHDLLLTKRGIALPATHGLRTSVERHRGRLQAELTKARIRRKLSSIEALKAYVESGLDDTDDKSEAAHPRWVRINSLNTSLEDQLETTFAGYDRVMHIDAVRKRGSRCLYLDQNVPNLLAVSPNTDISKTDAYKFGHIIFQDKASCFPAYLLDPLSEDGDIIDTCSAPGNKTTQLASILLSHASEPDECKQTIHAFEKNKDRAETLEKMVNLAGSHVWTKLHPGQDFLKIDPASPAYKNVGALLLDPSCSGSGIVGRDDMPQLHLPVVKDKSSSTIQGSKKLSKAGDPKQETRKRKHEGGEDLVDLMVDDDGFITAVNTDDEMKARLAALSVFQLELLIHAFKFPAARKITYSTCSIHAEENEFVVQQALQSTIGKEQGWRILKRDEQIRGMKEWPVRGSLEACGGDDVLADSCIRANKGDKYGTMGFFLAGFVRDQAATTRQEALFLRDGQGRLVRDLLGFPMKADGSEHRDDNKDLGENIEKLVEEETNPDYNEWEGFGGDAYETHDQANEVKEADPGSQKSRVAASNKHTYNAGKRRTDLVPKVKKRRQN